MWYPSMLLGSFYEWLVNLKYMPLTIILLHGPLNLLHGIFLCTFTLFILLNSNLILVNYVWQNTLSEIVMWIKKYWEILLLFSKCEEKKSVK